MKQDDVIKQIGELQKESFNIKKKIDDLKKLQRLLGMKEDLLTLISVLKDDFYTEEALEEEKEIRRMMDDEGNFNNISINDAEFVGHLSNINFGFILYKYKDRGYILTSNNDGTFNYEGTAEALLASLEIHDIFFNRFQL